MRRLLLFGLILWPVLAGAQAPPTADQAQQAAGRLRNVLDRYQALIHDLDLNDLPGNLPEYPAVTDLAMRISEHFGPLSRALMRGSELTGAEWTQAQTDLASVERDLTEFERRSFSLRVWAFWHNQGVKRPDWGLAVSTSLHKLPRERLACVAEVTDTVALAAARGEAESAQVLVVPLNRDLRGVRTTCKGLRGPGVTLPGTAVQCQPVGYLPLEAPAYETPWRGWWPDVLLPAEPVDVVRDQVQPLWLTVTVPRDQKPGEYTGDLYVRPENGGTLKLTVKLTVWACVLPETPTLPAEASLEATALTRWYGEARDGAAAGTVRERFAALLRAHRVRADEVGNAATAAVDLAGGEAVGQAAWWALTPQLAPPLPNLWLDRPAIEQRVLPWLAWQGGCRGLRLGPANRWDPNLPRAATSAGLTPSTWVTPRPDGCVGNGYGQLVYPGPNGQPLASLRLAVLRDGLEDYELFALAQPRAEQDAGLAKLLGERGGLLRSVEDGVGQPEALLAWRLKLGEWLSRSGEAGGASGR